MWRKDGEAYLPKNTAPTVKFGSSNIMIWGHFSVKGVGKISVIDGKMNAQKHKQILHENLISSVESWSTFRLFSSRTMIPSIQLNLQRSGCLKMLLFCNGQVSHWIWELWVIFENSNPKKSTNINNPMTICQEEWYKIPTNHCKKLIENHRKRSVEVNKGYSTKY